MRGRGIRSDQRGVSEIYGTVLIVTIAFGVAVFLLGTGWVVIDQLTTETTDSLAEDSMRNVDRKIDSLIDGSISESTTLLFPEDTGSDVSAVETEGTFNLSVRTSDDDLWNSTVAKHEGWNRSNSTEVDMGTIEYDSERRGITAYQGSGLWQKPTPDSQTQILSEPNVDYVGNSLDLGIVSLSDVEAITEGSEVRIKKSDRATTKKQWRQFLSKYWTNRYNPSVSVPLDVNVTIESQFADGWAEYAREQMTQQPEKVIYPYNGDENKVRIVFGKVGNPPVDKTNPEFGDDNILYAGSSDLAYKYHNDSADGDITGDATQFKITDLSTSPEYEVALYTNEGEWIIYNTSASGDRWVDVDGNRVAGTDIEALNTTKSGTTTGVSRDWYHIDPPAWLDNSASAPVCVVTSSSSSVDIRDYIDEDGEDCLENMVWFDESIVDPSRGTPDLNVYFESASSLDDTYGIDGKILQYDLRVNVENDGTATGTRALRWYAINKSSYVGDGTETDPEQEWEKAIYLNGIPPSSIEVSPGETISYNPSSRMSISKIQNRASYPITGERWTVFATLGGSKRAVLGGNPDNWNTLDTFEVTSPETQFDVEDVEPKTDSTEVGKTHRVEAWINESAGETSEIVTQRVQLRADGRLVNSTRITIPGGKEKPHKIDWEPQWDDVGTVTLNVSTWDDWNETTVEVTEPAPPEATFELDILGTNSSVEEGQDLGVDVNITNTGNVRAQKDVELKGFSDIPVDTKKVSLSPGQSTVETLTWQTVFGDNGTGTVEVVTPSDSDTTPAEITEFERESRDPLDVVFVLDRSGSMDDPACAGCSKTKAQAAVDASQNAVGSLNASTDRAGVVFFWDGSAIKKTNGKKLTSDFSPDGINQTIATLGHDGGTNSATGLEKAKEILDGESNRSRKKAVVLLNDGANNNCKPDDNDGDPSKILNDDPRDCEENRDSLSLTRDLAKGDVTVYSVAYGNVNQDPDEVEIDVAFMKETATVGNGKYYPAENDGQLSEAFDEIFTNLTEPGTPTFEIADIADTNDPVPAGERINVTATVKNTGAEGESIVSLVDHNGSYVSSERLDLRAGETTNVTLEWDTTGVSAGDKELTVKTSNNQKNTEVEIQGPKRGPKLTITSVNPDSDPAAGETIKVWPTIKNIGDEKAPDSTVLLTVINDATGESVASDETNIGDELLEGSIATPTLTWDTEPGDVGDYRFKVELIGYSDSETENITVDAPETNLDIDIENTNGPVRAGYDRNRILTVTVEVENKEDRRVDTTILLNDTEKSQTVALTNNHRIPAQSTKEIPVQWYTYEGDGSPSPIPVEARFANYVGSDTAEVEIKPGLSNVNYGAMNKSVDPLDINLEEIEIDT